MRSPTLEQTCVSLNTINAVDVQTERPGAAKVG